MTIRSASVRGFLAAVTIATSASAAGSRCTDGYWTIDGGALEVGSLTVGGVGLQDGVPLLNRFCRTKRWRLSRVEGETRLRALFLCRTTDVTGPLGVFPLRLRARLVDACTHMEGAFGIRRSGDLVRFTATRTGGECASNADCTAEAFCLHRLGQCAAEGVCRGRFTECVGAFPIVCGCDGQTYDSCTATMVGVSIAYDGPCSASCGGLTGIACPEGEFCDFLEGQCGVLDLQGRCVAVGDACPEFYAPVCGCDGVTYANDCFRQAAKAQKAHDGACEGCTSPLDCLPNEFCQAPDGACGGPGACTFIEQVCPGEYDPVCGCDGETYANRCRAAMHAVSIAHAGRCDGACGGFAGIPCPAGEFCDLLEGQCGVLDLPGRCVEVSDACPEFYAPVCGCDGVTYANDCFRQAAKAQKAHDGECAGCLSNEQCGSDAYCAKAPGHCDARGKCTPRPLGCPDNVDPVCGCDGTTYFNACEAAAAGVSVAHAGECRRICGGLAGIPCPEGEFCDLPAGECGSADLQGRCVEVGDACPEFYAPVCGCDGVTYANDCFRQAAKAQKAHDGPCECVPKTAPCEQTCDCYAQLGTAFCDDCPLLCPNCGDYWQCKDGACVEQCGVIPPDVQTCFEQPCAGNDACRADQYCAKPLGDCAGGGVCQARPLGCPDVYLPVCGCDGKTYGNRCDAAAAGASVAHEGECKEFCGGIAGIPCPAGQVCELPPGLCEWADLQGRCVPTGLCTQQYDPVCGCDGKTYPNDCERLNTGVQKAHDGACK